jgi:hypothetical protein
LTRGVNTSAKHVTTPQSHGGDTLRQQSKTIVIGHQCPLFPLSQETLFIGRMPPKNHECFIEVDDKALGDAFDGHVISEYFQLFYYFLHSTDNLSHPNGYYIYQYRKFLSRDGNAPAPPSMPYLLTSLPSEVTYKNIQLNDILSLVETKKVLIGPILSIGSMAENYGKYHVTQDFSMFILAMRDSLLFDNTAIMNFINFPYLIPSPSIGIFPTEYLLADLKALATVWEQFYKNYYFPREGYQRRVGGFLLERLHSFIILQRAIRDDLKNTISCFQYIVSEDGYPTPSA